MKFAFVMNEFSGIDPNKDTTVLFIEESIRRKHEAFWLTHDDLALKGNKVFGNLRRISLNRNEKSWVSLGEAKVENLEDFDALFMRYDPPFDLKYLTATYLVDYLVGKTFVMNSSHGIRLANEKIYSLNFSEFTPDTIVTTSKKEISTFLEEHKGRAIVKPLSHSGGHGIFMLRDDDQNLSSIIETATEDGKKHVMVQEYLKEVRDGDKRVLMLNGKVIGATLRVPQSGESRANIHAGATCEKSSLTEKELTVCDAIGPRLVKDGLHFVGLDFIGGYLTEVNVTSPTCMQEINRLDSVHLEKQVIDFVENASKI